MTQDPVHMEPPSDAGLDNDHASGPPAPTLVVLRRQFSPYGGAEMTVSQLARRLREAGISVSIAASRWKEAGNAIRFINVPSPRKPSWLGALLFARRCRRHAGVNSHSVVLSLDRTLGQDIYRAGDGCHRAWLRRRAMYDGWLKGGLLPMLRPLNWVNLQLERRVFDPARTGVVVANSELVRREVTELYRFPPDRVILIRNGVDHSRLQRITRREAREDLAGRYGVQGSWKVLLFLGSGFHRKGLAHAVGTLTELDDSWHLLVAGKGRTGRYQRLAARWGVASRVHFLGGVDEPVTLLRGADVFILPTLYDPCSNACLEALAAGTPVITTAANGAGEVIDQGSNGWVVQQPGDTLEMARAAKKLLEESEVQRCAAAVPGWERTVADFRDLVLSLTGSRPYTQNTTGGQE